MNFTEHMKQDPPRLVVQCRRNRAGDEEFQWGVTGTIPVLSLIGHLASVQADLCGGEWMPETDGQPALVIAYDPAGREFHSYVGGGISTGPLVGMLEVIKSILTGSRMAQHAGASQCRVLGPDGRSVTG